MNAVNFEKTPDDYTRIEPFSATIHHTSLTVYERSQIAEALVNVAHRIRLDRCSLEADPFYMVFKGEMK